MRDIRGDVGKFVSCSLRSDSPCTTLDGSTDPNCRLRLQCDGPDTCEDYAVNCSKDWRPLVDDLPLPVSFFVCGAATSSSGALEGDRVAAADRPLGGGDASGSTLTPRLETFLSSKLIGSERWSVASRCRSIARGGEVVLGFALSQLGGTVWVELRLVVATQTGGWGT